MRLVRFLASVAVAALSAMALVPKLVWEGGKWVTKNVFGAGGGGGAVAAQARAAAELQAAADEVAEAKAAPAPAANPSPVGTPDWVWGTAALQVLAGERDAAKGVLDEPALEYLLALTPEQGMRLAAFSPDRIGRHLTGNEPIKSLAQAASLEDYWGAEIKRLCAESARPRPLLRVNPRAGLDDEAPAPALAR